MRTFKNFPDNAICPLCKTDDAGETFLMPIDGTLNESIEEAQPAHTKCLGIGGYRYNREQGVIYKFID
jgi:hypothetical protein